MSVGTIQVSAEPQVLRWAREAAGLTPREVAEKIGKEQADFLAIEAGRVRPSYKFLEDLADLYKRPLASLLLPEPPSEPPLPHDFRRFPGTKKGLSKKTRLALRRAQRLRRIASELRESEGEGRPWSMSLASQESRDPEELATQVRADLGLAVDQQVAWSGSREALSKWIEAVEGKGVLVFQLPMALTEIRGASFPPDGIPAILLNGSDSVHGRIFTLFHEYCHVLLGTGGLCNPNTRVIQGRGQTTERLCNQFAAALLVPMGTLRSDSEVESFTTLDHPPMDQDFEALVHKYKVSRYVLWGRMRSEGVISRDLYQKKMSEWAARGEFAPEDEEGEKRGRGGGLPPARRCLRDKGRTFVSLVFESQHQGRISSNEALGYLEIRAKHLPAIEGLLRR